MKSAQQRAQNLYHFFGWQGGTIHQLEEVTGISANDLLNGEPSLKDIGGRYSQGACANETCGLSYRLELAGMVKGNREFWIGAACATVRGQS